MKKRIRLLIVTSLLMVIFPVGGFAAENNFDFRPLMTFEGGTRYRSGNIAVLDLHGSWRQMGRQYGRLLEGELQDLYQRAVVDYFIKEKGLSREDMINTAQGLYRYYPQRFKDILLGMAETSGLSPEAQVMLNALELYGTMSGCSGIFAWGPYTGGQSLIAGRNYDWFDSYTDFARSLTVTVLHPEAGMPTAFVTFAGVIYATTGINAAGLFLELNNGLPSGGGLSYANRVPAIANLLAFLVDCGAREHLDAAFQSTRPDFTFIINVADGRQACAYEWAPFALKQRTGESPGLLVATNHFVDPSWGMVLQPHTGFKTVLRRDNLLALGEKARGEIDVSAMKRILDRPMDKGGATWPPEGTIRTVYEVIAVPEDRALWIKVPGYQDWTPVDLKPLFASERPD